MKPKGYVHIHADTIWCLATIGARACARSCVLLYAHTRSEAPPACGSGRRREGQQSARRLAPPPPPRAHDGWSATCCCPNWSPPRRIPNAGMKNPPIALFVRGTRHTPPRVTPDGVVARRQQGQAVCRIACARARSSIHRRSGYTRASAGRRVSRGTACRARKQTRRGGHGKQSSSRRGSRHALEDAASLARLRVARATAAAADDYPAPTDPPGRRLGSPQLG
jgi:hypothetical protein